MLTPVSLSIIAASALGSVFARARSRSSASSFLFWGQVVAVVPAVDVDSFDLHPVFEFVGASEALGCGYQPSYDPFIFLGRRSHVTDIVSIEAYMCGGESRIRGKGEGRYHFSK